LTEKRLYPFSKDDFTVTAVEPWFKVKVQLIQDYFQAFLAETAGRADEIVLIDFFAGSGYYALGHQKEIVPMPALVGLQQDPAFTKCILVEPDPDLAKALKIRVNKYFRGRNVVIFEDSPKDVFEKLKLYVPASRKGYKVAVLCLVDPFSLQFPFSFYETLAASNYSFLIPYTFPLNDRHDFRLYTKEHRDTLKRFIGPNESSVYSANNNFEFYKKLVRVHQNNMLTLGLSVSVSAHRLESKQMDLPLFYMGLFSRQISTKSVSRDVQEHTQQQIELF
jgi:three-Cys-motif partner protein